MLMHCRFKRKNLEMLLRIQRSPEVLKLPEYLINLINILGFLPATRATLFVFASQFFTLYSNPRLYNIVKSENVREKVLE